MELLWLALIVAVYCLPLIVAAWRKKHNAGAIAVLNILAGWTFIGWLVAMVWASANDRPSP